MCSYHTVRRDKEGEKALYFSKNSVGNYSYWLLNRLEDEFYNPIRQTEEFIQIIKDLK